MPKLPQMCPLRIKGQHTVKPARSDLIFLNACHCSFSLRGPWSLFSMTSIHLYRLMLKCEDVSCQPTPWCKMVWISYARSWCNSVIYLPLRSTRSPGKDKYWAAKWIAYPSCPSSHKMAMIFLLVLHSSTKRVYRVFHPLTDLGWVDSSARFCLADGISADSAEQSFKMGCHISNLSEANSGLHANGTPCRLHETWAAKGELLFAPGSTELCVLEIWQRVGGLNGTSSPSLPSSIMYSRYRIKPDITVLFVPDQLCCYS